MGIFDWLFGTDNVQNGTVVVRDSKGNQKRVTKKNGKTVETVYVPAGGGAKFRNEQAMQDYLRRNGR